MYAHLEIVTVAVTRGILSEGGRMTLGRDEVTLENTSIQTCWPWPAPGGPAHLRPASSPLATLLPVSNAELFSYLFGGTNSPS